MKKILIAMIVFGIVCGRVVCADDTAFVKANELYRQELYEQAIDAYTQALSDNGALAEIYYNLGNAYFKINQLGYAIVQYLRAADITPRDADIRKNLEHAKTQIEYKIEDKTGWYVQQMRRVFQVVSDTECTMVLYGMLFVWLCLWLATVLMSNVRMLKIMRHVACVLSCIVVLMMAINKWVIYPGDIAVVIEDIADIRYGPSPQDKVVYRLHEGLQVYVVDRRETWSRVKLDNHEVGWVLNESIELV